MASEREDFNLSGPLHLANVDWRNADHRSSVAACLVQGVYVLERDRQENRRGREALAPLWWEFFHFRLHTELVDDVDRSIFGTIYEFRPPVGFSDSQNEGPKYVIAFRGTLTKGDAFARDLQLDIHIIKNGLHQTSRFELAMQAVRNIVATFGNSNVWLAGHSLGAAMAMLTGKNMAKTGIFLESFLFNPPFLSAPIERIRDKNVKHGIRIASSFIAAGLTVALKVRQQRTRNLLEDPFASLASWVPSLFVHRGDHICAEYIGYFDHRKKMEQIGAGAVEKLATQNSFGGLLMSAMGRESEEALHLIPSANLIVNLAPALDLKQAHGIHQWWQPNLQLQSKVHTYRW